MDGSRPVVAVRAVGDGSRGGRAGSRPCSGSKAVAVPIGEPGGGVGGVVLVGCAVAVVVDPVAGLCRGRGDLPVAVVAVAAVRDVAGRRCTRDGRRGQIAESVGVGVREPDAGVAGAVRVDDAVAVVVDAVAGLGRVRMGLVAGVVAVAVVGDVCLGSCAGGGGGVGVAEAIGIEVREPDQCVHSIGLVDGVVAVVVDAVARLGCVGVDFGVSVVAVVSEDRMLGGEGACDRRSRQVAVAVAVHVLGPPRGVGCIGFVDGPVAVVVEAVAELLRCWADPRCGVVAVSALVGRGGGLLARDHRLVAPAVGVEVDEPRLGVRGVRFVRRAVTVVVDAIAALRRLGMDVRAAVVTVVSLGQVAWGSDAALVGLGGVSVAVGVVVSEPRGLVHRAGLVHGFVAVVVRAVAALGRARVSGRRAVVAVGAVGDHPLGGGACFHRGCPVSEAVQIRVDEPEEGVDRVLVGIAVTVVISVVAALGRGRVGRSDGVVAVACVTDVADGGATAGCWVCRVAEPVSVCVCEPGGRVGCVRFVDEAVAVVVSAVAAFLGARMDVCACPVTVLGVRDVVDGPDAGREGRRGIPEVVAVVVGEPRGRVDRILVRGAVAVFVHAVAVFVRAGVDRRVGVAAVARRRRMALWSVAGKGRESDFAVSVPVCIRPPRLSIDRAVVDQAVAVSVHPVAVLVRTRVDGRVVVVAVGAARRRRHEAVVVLVEAFVAIAHAVAVTVGVERVGPDRELLGISEAVPVGVGGQRIGAQSCLRAVVQPIVVGVGVGGVGAQHRFEAVGEAVGVPVGRERSGVDSVGETVVVGVRVERVGAGDGLRPIAGAVAVGVGVHRVGARAHFRAVGAPVAVAVCGSGVGAERDLVGVAQAVPIGVGVLGVRARRVLVPIGQTIVVGVRIERVGAGGVLYTVTHAVVVAVGVEGIGARRELYQVRAPVSIRVLASVRDTVAVGVELTRVDAERPLRPVHDSVAIGVRIERVGVGLLTVEQPVVVGVRIGRVRAGSMLLGCAQPVTVVVVRAVGDAVAIGVPLRGIAAHAQLKGVAQAVSVGVGVPRVGAQPHLRAVVQPVVVRVGIASIGADRHLEVRGQAVAVVVVVAVLDSVAVGVRVARIRPDGGLLAVVESVCVSVFVGVGDAVTVAVDEVGVRSGSSLLTIVEAVTVGVGHQRVGAVGELGAVVESVAVRVLVAIGHEIEVRVGERGVGARPGLVGVGEAVAVAVLPRVSGSVCVGVRQAGIGAQGRLDAVVEPVAIGVRRQRVGAVRPLFGVGPTVAIEVGFAVGRAIGVAVRAGGIGACGQLPAVGEPVAVGVLLCVVQTVSVAVRLGERGPEGHLHTVGQAIAV